MRNEPLFHLLFFFLLCLFGGQVLIYATQEEDDLDRIIQKLERLNGWTVLFEESLFSSSGAIERREGNIIFSKPFIFRVSYFDNNTEVLSDGDSIYFVIHSKKKVYVKPLTQDVSQNLIMDILSGDFKLKKFFRVLQKNKNKGIFELVPHQNSIKDVRKIVIKTMKVGFPIESIRVFLRGDVELNMKIKEVKYESRKIDLSFPDYKVIREMM